MYPAFGRLARGVALGGDWLLDTLRHVSPECASGVPAFSRVPRSLRSLGPIEAEPEYCPDGPERRGADCGSGFPSLPHDDRHQAQTFWEGSGNLSRNYSGRSYPARCSKVHQIGEQEKRGVAVKAARAVT